MRTLQYPEERINWLEEHKAIDSKLGDELRAFAAVSGMDGPAQMYGFTNDARVRSASITSPIRSAYMEMRENSNGSFDKRSSDYTCTSKSQKRPRGF